MLRCMCGHLPNIRQAREGDLLLLYRLAKSMATNQAVGVWSTVPSHNSSGGSISRLSPHPGVPEHTSLLRTHERLSYSRAVLETAHGAQLHHCRRKKQPMGICEIHYDKKEGGIKRQVAPPGRPWKSRGPSSPSWSQASHRFCPKSPLRLAQHSGKSPLSKLEKSDPTLRTKHSCESLPGEATRMVHGKGFLWQLQRTTMVQH